MDKDIFIDNNIASKFANPPEEDYKKLIEWLVDKDKIYNSVLVVSKSLLKEYYSSARMAVSSTSIPAIVDILTREGRLKSFSKGQIDDFKNLHFKKRVTSRFLCNYNDRDHIATVLLSNRKYVLTKDQNLTLDLLNFPRFNVEVSEHPSSLAYE